MPSIKKPNWLMRKVANRPNFERKKDNLILFNVAGKDIIACKNHPTEGGWT